MTLHFSSSPKENRTEQTAGLEATSVARVRSLTRGPNQFSRRKGNNIQASLFLSGKAAVTYCHITAKKTKKKTTRGLSV